MTEPRGAPFAGMRLGGSRLLGFALGLAVVVGAAARHPSGRRVATTAPIAAEEEPTRPLPTTLAETGLYADFASRTIAADSRPFSPQYPLWTDGATKRRWVRLPKGASIDASSPDAWQFPVGTKLWKEFSFGRPVETRFIERTREGWRFATYVWSEDGKTAALAEPRGQLAPGTEHQIPAAADCRVCHANGATPVLGFSALQLSTDRAPDAVHGEPLPEGALDLERL